MKKTMRTPEELANLARNPLFVDSAARRAHDTVTFMCATGNPSWNGTQEYLKKSTRDGVVWLLLNPDATPEKSHSEWMKRKTEDGWIYGQVRSVEAKTHPCLVPFDKLSKNDKMRCELFVSSVWETVDNI